MANKVNIVVHKNFFDKIFEKERKKLESSMKVGNLSQTKFTEYLANTNATIRYKMPRQNRMFAPRRKR